MDSYCIMFIQGLVLFSKPIPCALRGDRIILLSLFSSRSVPKLPLHTIWVHLVSIDRPTPRSVLTTRLIGLTGITSHITHLPNSRVPQPWKAIQKGRARLSTACDFRFDRKVVGDAIQRSFSAVFSSNFSRVQ